MARRRRNQGLQERTLSVSEAIADPGVVAELEELQRLHRSPQPIFEAATLAEHAGFDVTADVTDFGDQGPAFVTWRVRIPDDVERNLIALVWTDAEGKLDYTLTRSTRHSDWQLTSWARDGAPWGHRDLKKAEDAFDAGPRGAGVGLTNLSQVVFADGRILVRAGAEKIAVNPSIRPTRRKLKRKKAKRKAKRRRNPQSGREAMQQLLASFRSGYMAYRNAHWMVSGTDYYGNHLLLQRIYEDTQKHVDAIGERIVGLWGKDVIDPKEQARLVELWSGMFAESDDPMWQSLAVAQELRSQITYAYDTLAKEDELTLGTDDLLMSISSNKEEHIYLLQQALNVTPRGPSRARNPAQTLARRLSNP